MNPIELKDLKTSAEAGLLGRIAALEAELEAKHQQYVGAVIQLAEAHKDGERLSKMQSCGADVKYGTEWRVWVMGVGVGYGETLRAAIDNAMRGTR